MKLSGILRGVVLTGLSLAVLAACVVPADPEHIAYSAITNDCANPISAAVSKNADGFSPEAAPSSLLLVEPGERVSFASPLYLPVAEKLYLWAVAPDAKSVGNPQAVMLTDLEQETQSSGTTVFHITVSGSMCPTAG
jgi:hypothetical protein